MKFKDFLMTWYSSNHSVHQLKVYVYNPVEEDVILLRNGIRYYLLFGNYYVESIDLDQDKNETKLIIILTETISDPIDSCPFCLC